MPNNNSLFLFAARVAPKPRAFGTVYRMGLPWLGEGLLLTNGDRWARDRKLLTPGFHFDVLQPYVPVFNETVEILLVSGNFATPVCN